MRSSKSRSRNKSNRSNNSNNRSGVNIVNRVFESSGPEGKVRGTPQQIIEKYNQLARDAQLSNDRVAAENFQQHAEHYLRLLGEAQREIDARRDQELAQQAQRDRQQRHHQNAGQHQPQGGQGEQPYVQPQPEATQPEQSRPETASKEAASSDADQPVQPTRSRRQRAPRSEQAARKDQAPHIGEAERGDATAAPQPQQDDVVETATDDRSGLVETPESKPGKPRRPRAKPRPKADSAKADTGKADSGKENPSGTSEAAE